MGAFSDLFERVAKSGNWSRPRAMWPVREGNGQVMMIFDRELAQKAEIGDLIDVASGGHVRRIAKDSWLQWEFVPPAKEQRCRS